AGVRRTAGWGWRALCRGRRPSGVEATKTEGSEFQTGFPGPLVGRGIRHIYIKPATPRPNGKVERSHRIDGEEFYRQLKGRRHRRHRLVQRQAPRVAGLLQLPSSARRPRRPDPLRTTAAKDNSKPLVNDLRQL